MPNFFGTSCNPQPNTSVSTAQCMAWEKKKAHLGHNYNWRWLWHSSRLLYLLLLCLHMRTKMNKSSHIGTFHVCVSACSHNFVTFLTCQCSSSPGSVSIMSQVCTYVCCNGHLRLTCVAKECRTGIPRYTTQHFSVKHNAICWSIVTWMQ